MTTKIPKSIIKIKQSTWVDLNEDQIKAILIKWYELTDAATITFLADPAGIICRIHEERENNI